MLSSSRELRRGRAGNSAEVTAALAATVPSAPTMVLTVAMPPNALRQPFLIWLVAPLALEA